MRLGGSLWLGLLQSLRSRRARRLLSLIGSDPFNLGWEQLWQGAVLYWVMRPRLKTLIYVGESICMIRRFGEHIARVLHPHGYTQQPFFRFLRGDSFDLHVIRCSFCEWLFLPIRMSSVITHLRKAQERLMIADVGSLNPPKVYFWLQRHFGRRPRHRRDRGRQRRPLSNRPLGCPYF